jgi:Flp pilus assembly pilin Flp
MFKEIAALIKDEEGATIMEYAAVIGAGVVAVVALIALFRIAAAKIQEGAQWFGG